MEEIKDRKTIENTNEIYLSLIKNDDNQINYIEIFNDGDNKLLYNFEVHLKLEQPLYHS